MNSQLEEIALGIVTSVITGLAVWFWSKFRFNRKDRLKAKFFGMKKGEAVFCTINQHPAGPKLMSHGDILTLFDVTKVAHELSAEIIIKPTDEARLTPGDQVEFCIGGIDSNPRTKVFLDKYFNGLKMKSYKDSESLKIYTNNESFSYIKAKKAFSILAKFYPENKKNPVFLICGQTNISNRAAGYYLNSNFEDLYAKYKEQPFCLIIGVEDFHLFGYKSAKLIGDFSDRLKLKRETSSLIKQPDPSRN